MEFCMIKASDNVADIYIFGDIEQSSLPAEIATLEVDKINVYVNSYGGEVAEGLAIYNALKNHKAEITTVCTGFACSSASIIFMAGDKRVMMGSTILMIHNAWVFAMGDHNDLNQTAKWLEKVSSSIREIYESITGIEPEKLQAMMNEECWLTPDEAVSLGFATEKSEEKENGVRNQIVNKITSTKENVDDSKAHFMSFFNFNEKKGK